MTEQHTLLWEPGSGAAPLPPLVDPSDVTQEEQPLVSLYRTYGPVFRLPRPGQAPRIILTGPEINVFIARHEDEFFTTGEQWEQFDAMISQQPKSGMTEARDKVSRLGGGPVALRAHPVHGGGGQHQCRV